MTVYAKGKLYACCIKDVFSNRIVGCATGERMTADLAVSALRQAIARRQPESTVVVHSDRGGQFRARSFVAVLKANNLTGSDGPGLVGRRQRRHGGAGRREAPRLHSRRAGWTMDRLTGLRDEIFVPSRLN